MSQIFTATRNNIGKEVDASEMLLNQITTNWKEYSKQSWNIFHEELDGKSQFLKHGTRVLLKYEKFEPADEAALPLHGPRAEGLPNLWCYNEIEGKFIALFHL